MEAASSSDGGDNETDAPEPSTSDAVEPSLTAEDPVAATPHNHNIRL